MHHVRHVFVSGSRASLQCFCSSKSRVTGLRPVSLQYRQMSSSNEEEGGDKKDVKEASLRRERSSKAKAKLDNLLKSIVQDSKEAAEKKSQEKVIDMKLAAPTKERAEPSPESIKTLEEIETEKDLGREIVKAVKKVAEAVEGDEKLVESELVQKLKTQMGKKVDLSEIFAGMKIDRSPKPETATSTVGVELSRAHRVKKMLDEKSKPKKPRTTLPRQKRSPPPPPSYVPIDLFGAPPLGIFTSAEGDKAKEASKAKVTMPKLNTWDALHARDLKLAVTHPPANGFEEMILWTEQGKMWKFPIDNEQGLDEEAKVPFHEHVFLQPQIESWCPTRGPVRQFMELVCIGLSKNPFLTVKEKHEHIEWYHQYFKGKSALLKEVGAGEIK